MGTLDLANWMGQLEPILGESTLLDLSLPGAHDAMTYDLSDTLSDGYEGIDAVVSDLLHDVTPLVAGSFVRAQGQTQGINMTSFLDAGVRFIDFRIMYTHEPDTVWFPPQDWYCLLTLCKEIETNLAYAGLNSNHVKGFRRTV